MERLTTYPIKEPEIWEFFTTAMACYWPPFEITFTKDRDDFNLRLTPDERNLIGYILSFFASADAIVNLNIIARFKQDIPYLEAHYFYDFQIAMENIHAITYSRMIDCIYEDPSVKNTLLNAHIENPAVSSIAKWMFATINSEMSISERLLRMACIEGILFTGSFCIIYWLQSRGLMPGLAQANGLIARDEGLHTAFALHMHKRFGLLPVENAHQIINESVELAAVFIKDAIPNNLIGMNFSMLMDYIKSQADNLLKTGGYPKKYNCAHSFNFMHNLNLENKTNFFEARPTEYSKPTVATDLVEIDI